MNILLHGGAFSESHLTKNIHIYNLLNLTSDKGKNKMFDFEFVSLNVYLYPKALLDG